MSVSLILASQSPRRAQLLRSLGVRFTVQAANIDESPKEKELPTKLVKRLATEKANYIYQQCSGPAWVLGGDTVVVIGDRCLGKPVDRADAMRMLQELSATTHWVISAMTLLGEGFAKNIVVRTAVTFGAVTASQIAQYCDTAEPYDKAGAYGIQGLGGVFVERINGSYSSVVGLPLYQTRLLLVQGGLISSLGNNHQVQIPK